MPPGAEAVLEYWCVISLKSGDLAGSFDKLKVRSTSPSGEVKEMTDKPIQTTFTGGAHGINVRIKLTIAIKKLGLMWIDVLWGDDLLTRIPLDLKPLEEAPKQD